MTESLWPNFSTETVEENNSLEILKTQAKQLSKQTKGIVRATFSKINYATNYHSIAKAVENLTTMTLEKELLDETLKDKKDANELYKTVKYKFEIYNDNYRFRLFAINYRLEYPITIEIDEDIKNELQHENIPMKETIDNDSDLKELLGNIFNSTKVKTIIVRMIHDLK